MMKRLIFLCFFSFFIVLLLFHRPLISFFIHRSLQGYVQTHWGQPLHYEQLSFEGNQIVILKPELKESSRLIAERLLLSFDFNFFSRDLYVKVTLDKPRGHFQSLLSSHRKNWEKAFSHQGKWIHLHPSLHIKDALLDWTLKDQSQWQLLLDIEANHRDGGVIQIYFDPEERSKNCLTIEASAFLEGIQAHGQCCQVECASLFALAKLLGLEMPITQFFYDMDLEQGVLDANFEAEIGNGKIQKLNIKQFGISTLVSTFRSAKIRCTCDRISGYGNFFPQNKDMEEAFKGELHLAGGEVVSVASPAFFPLKAIQAHLVFGEGGMDDSLVTLEFAGLKGTMKMARESHPRQISLKLEGKANQLIDFFPVSIKKGLSIHFDQQPLLVLAHLEIKNQQLKIRGDLHLSRKEQEKDLIHFACQWGIGKEGVQSFIPSGSVYAQQISLEPYLTPFILQDAALKLTGEAEVRGSFDEKSFALKYRMIDFSMENDDLYLKKEKSFDPFENLWGEHTFDWLNGSHQGFLPIRHFSYLAKKKNLFFEDIQGMIFFKDQALSISPIEAYCKGIYFSGSLDLDYRDPTPGIFDLTLACPTFFGTVSQIQSFLSHLMPPSFLNQIPLEGECSAKEKGLNLYFTFSPLDYDLEGEIQGAIVNAVLPLHQEAALKGLDMDVHYDHGQQTLTFTDIQGTWLVGKPKRAEEYFFHSPSLCISHLSDPDFAVDFSLFKEKRELIRLIGYTETREEKLKRIYLDLENSHLSAFRLQKWQCLIKNWSSIEEFAVQATIDVGQLLGNLHDFHPLLGQFDQILSFNSSFHGEGEFSFYYHPLDRSYSYKLDFPQIEENNGVKHRAILTGSRQHDKWIIDQLEWDDWTLYAELEPKSDQWSIPFLGLSLGKTILIGLEGNYFPQDARLQAQLKYCKVDEEQQAKWGKWKTLISEWLSGPFELQLKEKHLSFSTKIKQNSLWMKVVGDIEGPFFKSGKFIFSQEQDQKYRDSPLVVDWIYQTNQGWKISSVQGDCYGCSLHLMEDANQKKKLKGQIVADFKRLSPLLTPEMQEIVRKLKLSSVYLFQGEVTTDFERGESLWDAFDYEGRVISQPVTLRGFQLQSLEAYIHATPGRIEIERISVEDPAIECQIPDLTAICEKETRQWSLFIPRLTIKNLRPALLKEEEAYFLREGGKYHSLVIKRLELQDCCGILDDCSTWQGVGTLHFLNPSRKNLSHPLLAIPAEIILRLGLDSQVLNPITGTIYFELKGKRFYLTRFKDVYSEGRGSKFYLAQGPTSSWVDLNGNLFVQIRMRHYNLFFKLAELFTVSVQGSLRYPVYTLTKQNKSVLRKGHFLSIDL